MRKSPPKISYQLFPMQDRTVLIEFDRYGFVQELYLLPEDLNSLNDEMQMKFVLAQADREKFKYERFYTNNKLKI